jgi:putative addiction module CopG family antidote
MTEVLHNTRPPASHISGGGIVAAGLSAMCIDKPRVRANLNEMNISLPAALEDFVSTQLRSGEFCDASEVVSEALRLLREEREGKAMEEMRAAFAGV